MNPETPKPKKAHGAHTATPLLSVAIGFTALCAPAVGLLFWRAVLGHARAPSPGRIEQAALPPAEAVAPNAAAPAPIDQPPFDPETDPSLFGQAYRAATSDRPTFVEPDVDLRLELIGALLRAYNHQDRAFTDLKTCKVPTAEALKAWFQGLSYAERTAISFAFHSRERYLTFVRQERERAEPGKVDPSQAGGEYAVHLFDDPLDVFVSPRDGKPFVIDWQLASFPKDGMLHVPRIVACEAAGVRRGDRRTLGTETQRRCLNVEGWLDTIRETEEDAALPGEANPAAR